MIKLNPTYIEKKGIKEFVVISVDEFSKIQDCLEDYEDLLDLRKAKEESVGQPRVSWQVAKGKLKALP